MGSSDSSQTVAARNAAAQGWSIDGESLGWVNGLGPVPGLRWWQWFFGVILFNFFLLSGSLVLASDGASGDAWEEGLV